MLLRFLAETRNNRRSFASSPARTEQAASSTQADRRHAAGADGVGRVAARGETTTRRVLPDSCRPRERWRFLLGRPEGSRHRPGSVPGQAPREPSDGRRWGRGTVFRVTAGGRWRRWRRPWGGRDIRLHLPQNRGCKAFTNALVLFCTLKD